MPQAPATGSSVDEVTGSARQNAEHGVLRVERTTPGRSGAGVRTHREIVMPRCTYSPNPSAGIPLERNSQACANGENCSADIGVPASDAHRRGLARGPHGMRQA